MKKISIFDSLRTSKFRHGGYATLLILAAVAIVVIVNLLVEQVPWKADLTENRLYSLSEQTKTVLSGLTSDITVTTLTKVGQENLMIKETLDKYTKTSGHVKLATVNPERNPGWAKQYDTAGTGLQDGSIVVVGPKRFKTIAPYDMYNIDYQTNPNQPQVTGMTVEQRMTSAIQYVTVDKNPVIYALQGHGETTLGSLGLSTVVEDENYEVKDLSLISAASVASDADLLLVMAPVNDFTAQETDKIRAYLEKGGRALFIIGLPQMGTPFPNLNGLLKSYGIAIQRLVVVEGDPNRYASGRPVFLLPKLGSHDILSPLSRNDLPVLIPISQGIETLPLKKKSITVDALLTTSQNSWGKVDYEKSTTYSKEKGDVEGPFTLAVAVTDQSSDPNMRDTRLVVTGSSAFLRAEVLASDPTNSDFFLNTLSWLREKKDTISIQPKSLFNLPLRLNQLQSLLLSGLVVILMPLIVLGGGFAVWMRRRHL